MNDPKVVLLVVGMLGLFAIGSLASVTYLLSVGVGAEAIALVSGLAGTAVGALAAILSNNNNSQKGIL